MKHLKYIVTIFLTFHLSFYANSQNTTKLFIGTWKTTQADQRVHSVSEETWIFQNAKSGVWDRKLILSSNAIICFLKNPFTWQIMPSNKIKITLGKTECKCTASEKKFEEGLDDFVKNLKGSYDNEFFEYKYKISGSTLIYFDEIKLIRQ